MVSPQHKINIEKETKHKDYTIIKGNFVSPVNELSPGILPDEVKIAQFEMITPNKLNDVKPACIHMAGIQKQVVGLISASFKTCLRF